MKSISSAIIVLSGTLAIVAASLFNGSPDLATGLGLFGFVQVLVGSIVWLTSLRSPGAHGQRGDFIDRAER